MLVINYSGNRPQQDRFKFAVNGDNNSQTIKFVLKKQQGDIDLSSPSFTIYFLCQSQDKRFVDKAEITTVSEEGNDIILEYKLLGKHTQFKSIDVGVSFENENQEVVYKTASATISIQNGIMADEEIENLYPSIIAQMQAEIDELKQNQGTKLYLHQITIVHQGGKSFEIITTSSNAIKLSDLTPVFQSPIESPFLALGKAYKLSLTENSSNIYIDEVVNDNGSVKIVNDSSIVVANITSFTDTVAPL